MILHIFVIYELFPTSKKLQETKTYDLSYVCYIFIISYTFKTEPGTILYTPLNVCYICNISHTYKKVLGPLSHGPS